MADAPEIVEKSITFEAAPERLWGMLTDQESFATWYAFGGATIEAEPGGVLAVYWPEHGTFRGEVKRLGCSYWGEQSSRGWVAIPQLTKRRGRFILARGPASLFFCLLDSSSGRCVSNTKW